MQRKAISSFNDTALPYTLESSDRFSNGSCDIEGTRGPGDAGHRGAGPFICYAPIIHVWRNVPLNRGTQKQINGFTLFMGGSQEVRPGRKGIDFTRVHD